MDAIGIDVGGTKMAAGLVDLEHGSVLHRAVAPTLPERGGAAVLADALRLASNLLDRARRLDRNPGGIGVAVAELVDLDGNVTSGHTIAWEGERITDAFGALVPAVVVSDVRAAALAEARFGAGRGLGSFVYVTVGTGISSTLVLEGIPFAGARGNAIIVGSGAWTSTCPHCGEESDHVLEDLASGPALVRRYRDRVAADASRTDAIESAEDVLAAAARGDADAVAVVEHGARTLGVGVAFLVNVLDPDAVVVGGGLGLSEGMYRDRFEASLRAHVWAPNTRPLPVLAARLGTDAALVGAAASAPFEAGS